MSLVGNPKICVTKRNYVIISLKIYLYFLSHVSSGTTVHTRKIFHFTALTALVNGNNEPSIG